MRKLASDSLQIAAWFICVISIFLSLLALSFFSSGSGWAGVGLVMLLLYYVPFTVIGCIGPLIYMVLEYKAPRDIGSLKVAAISTVALVVISILSLWLAPHGNGG